MQAIAFAVSCEFIFLLLPFAAAFKAVAQALFAFDLLFMPFAFATATGLLILLACSPRSTIEATPVLRRWVAACRGREHVSAATTLKPILAQLLVNLVLHDILARFAYHTFCRKCDHGGSELVNGLAFAALTTSQDVSLLAAGEAFPVIFLLQLRSWKGILYLG